MTEEELMASVSFPIRVETDRAIADRVLRLCDGVGPVGNCNRLELFCCFNREGKVSFIGYENV